MKKIIIIGGGVAGLSAGIYARLSGFEVEIFEKNSHLGGECTAWIRKGCHIDNSTHWLTGCHKTDALYSVWETLGVLGPEIDLYREPYYYAYEKNGQRLSLWRDRSKAEEDFLSVSPKDEKKIRAFFRAVKRAESVQPLCEKEFREMSFIEKIKTGLRMRAMLPVLLRYGSISVKTLGESFSSPLITGLIRDGFVSEYKAYKMITAYAFFTSDSTAIPQGGSLGLCRRMQKRLESLGGKIHLNADAQKIRFSGNRATHLELTDGTSVAGDYFLCAADIGHTFEVLLSTQSQPRFLRRRMVSGNGVVAPSCFCAVFQITTQDAVSLHSGTTVLPCETLWAADRRIQAISLRLYDYDEQLYPKDRRVVQCQIPFTDKDFPYWQQLYRDPIRYQNEKQRLADELEQLLTQYAQDLRGKLLLIDTYSPMTFARYCHATHGAYMSFSACPGHRDRAIPYQLRGIQNVFLAGQWVQDSGGLPIAALSGKFAVRAIEKRHIPTS